MCSVLAQSPVFTHLGLGLVNEPSTKAVRDRMGAKLYRLDVPHLSALWRTREAEDFKISKFLLKPVSK